MAPKGDLSTIEIAPGTVLPVHYHAKQSLGQSGLTALLVADGTLFASLVFGLAFLSVVTPASIPPVAGAESLTSLIGMGVIAVALILASGLSGARGAGAAQLGVVLNAIAFIALGWLALTQLDDPTAHARDALRAAVAGFVGLHVIAATGMAAFVADQYRRGEINAATEGAHPGWRKWQNFTTATTLITAVILLAQVFA